MGELARKPGAPTFADSPMDLLTRPERGFTIYEHYLPPVGFAAIIGSTVPVYNLAFKRPVYAGLPLTFLLAGVGAYLGSLYRDWKFQLYSEKEAVLKHYITLHPEDFPPYERHRYKDLFLPWVPIR